MNVDFLGTVLAMLYLLMGWILRHKTESATMIALAKRVVELEAAVKRCEEQREPTDPPPGFLKR